jgi:hypothetical protein
MTNAIRFSPLGGLIRVEVSSLNQSDKKFIKIVFCDQGPGVPTEFLPHIFSRFSQAESEITKIHGFCMFDWYPIILNSKNIFAIQSSGYSFIDSIHKHLPHKNLFLLNDTCEVDRLLVPTYNWNVDFFINKRLK